MTDPTVPPGWLRLAAALLLPRDGREFILGDLAELFAERARREGRARATRKYAGEMVVSIVSRRSWRGRRRGPGMRRPGMMRGLGTDVRAAVRALRRESGFVALVAFTLALGIGSTAAVFGMVNQLLLRPLAGVQWSDRAGYLSLQLETNPENGQGLGLATPDFEALREQASLLEGLGSYGRTDLTLTRENSRPMAVRTNTVHGDFFEVLGVRAAEGRLPDADGTALHSDPLIVVISDRLRAALFPSSAEVIGRTLRMNGRSLVIVGVTGGGFAGPERGDEVDAWVPYGALVPLLGFDPETLTSLRHTMHDEMVVRVRAGVSTEAAAAEIASILDRLASRGAENREYLASLRPVLHPGLHLPPLWRERTLGSLRVLGGVVLVVLLIACVNVANLLLVRNVKRRALMATQRALGASSARIARQQIVESMLLGLIGTLAGVAAAWLIALPFRDERLLRMPAFEGFVLDGRVLMFASVMAIVTAVLFGTLPALLAGRFDLVTALKAAGPHDTGRIASLGASLSAGQIALSVALLIGGLLLTRTVSNLYAVDTGMDIENVLWLPVEVPRGLDPAGADALQRRLIATVEPIPGVERVALDLYGPHGSRMIGRIALPGADSDGQISATMTPVTPGWFEMFGVSMIRGRAYGPDDWRPGNPGRVILTAALARRLFGTDDVIGRRVHAGSRGEMEAEVVGVTRDLRMAYAPGEPHEAFFVPFDAAPPFPFVSLLIRTRAPDARLAREIRTAVEGVLPEQPVPDAAPLTDRVHMVHSERRMFSRLLGLLSTLAVLLAAVGLYGVIAFAVAGRRREFGIRLALGARSRRIAALVARYAGAVIGTGLALGLAAAWAFSRVLESRLFGVAPTDPGVYLFAALLFAGVAAFACWWPVRTATRVDPVVTLRQQ